MLLPEAIWPRWADAAEVIRGWPGDVPGVWGHRQAAAHLDRAERMVRRWIRRFRGQPEADRRYFTVAPVAVADDPVMPDPSRTPLTDAVSATPAAHRAPGVNWGRMNTVSRWEFAGRSAILRCSPMAPAA
ncbi:hypothetical protein BOG92_011265 [Streptomyces sp. WAC00263]|nr:hypothetical protein BOG92_011265 [Streptomyces sp. WAC00263]